MKNHASGLLAVVLTLALASPALAGWVMEEVITVTGGPSTTNTIYMQDNKVKNVSGQKEMMFDAEKGLIYFILPDRQAYWSGKPEEFQQGIKAGTDKMMEEHIKQMPPEQRQAFEQYQKQMEAQSRQAAAPKKFKVEVKKTSDQAKIAGYPGQKYQVWVDGVLKEELWLCPQLDFSDAGDPEKFRRLTEGMKGPGQEASYESSPEYQEITTDYKKGYRLKSVNYDDSGNAGFGNEVRKIEKKKIPASEFQVPKGYRKLSITELVRAMSGQ